jgi:hypothetical protein
MLWVPLVLVGSLLSAAFFYVLVSEWALRRRAASAGATDGRASALPPLGKVAAFLVFWVASVEAVFFTLLKAPAAGARFECRKCGRVTTRAERRCPKCGAIDCWKSRAD